MESIGKLIVNAPFPLTPQVLSQLKQLSQLEFAMISQASRSGHGLSGSAVSGSAVSASTLDIPESVFDQVEVALQSFRPSSLLKLESIGDGNYFGLLIPSANKYLLVLEKRQNASFLTVSFLLPLITGLLSAIGVSVVATWQASRITRRIGILKNQIVAIASGETLAELKLGPNDDIQSLQTAMRLMSIELAESKRRIAENERTRLIQLLASGLAHELRNHLTGARLALQTCESDATDHEAIAIATQQMDLAEQQVRRLLTVQTGIGQESEPPILCMQLLKNVVELVRPMANHRQVNVDVFPPLDSDSEEKDRLLGLKVRSANAVTGAVLNLVINAMEAAGPNGQVKIRVASYSAGTGESDESKTNSSNQPRQGAIVWQISDSGSGPPPSIVKHLFEPFVTAKPEGVGLGLAMCKRVAISLGGSISWERSNGWTTFEFRIPTIEP